jgi:hypothetical protein
MLSASRKQTLRQVFLLLFWMLLVWFGLTSIDNHDGEMLVLYVFAGASGIVALVAHLWKGPA